MKLSFMKQRLFTAISAAILVATVSAPALAQKTDTVQVRNGDRMVGEMKDLQRGELEFKTDAMSTVYVKWPRVITVNTDKEFEIVLEDGRIFFGSLSAGSGDSVVVKTQSKTVSVPTQSVVTLQRIQADFWQALDGNLNLGFDFTQQNAKTDLNLSGQIRYARRSNVKSNWKGLGFDDLSTGYRATQLNFNSTYGRQDGVEDIQRFQAGLSHLRQLKHRRFVWIGLEGERNSQLSLDFRTTIAIGLGRFLVQSNRVDVEIMAGPAFAREQYSGESPDNSIPFIFGCDVEYFSWGARTNDLSGQLGVLPILDQWGRWRLNFTLSYKREVAKNLYLNFTVNEVFDSDPQTADANKNDISFTTSLGWTF